MKRPAEDIIEKKAATSIAIISKGKIDKEVIESWAV